MSIRFVTKSGRTPRPDANVKIPTFDVAATVRFYQSLGLAASILPDAAGRRRFECPGLTLTIFESQDLPPEDADSLRFVVDDVERAFAAAKAAGGITHQSPYDGKHNRRAELIDGDGRRVLLMQSRSAAKSDRVRPSDDIPSRLSEEVAPPEAAPPSDELDDADAWDEAEDVLQHTAHGLEFVRIGLTCVVLGLFLSSIMKYLMPPEALATWSLAVGLIICVGIGASTYGKVAVCRDWEKFETPQMIVVSIVLGLLMFPALLLGAIFQWWPFVFTVSTFGMYGSFFVFALFLRSLALQFEDQFLADRIVRLLAFSAVSIVTLAFGILMQYFGPIASGAVWLISMLFGLMTVFIYVRILGAVKELT